ncbi:hypothetical protein PV325_005740 [Microctonus aethiopoides]|nr:hypothetical protein PV325_005740 [Microctonus aethiopoides]
MAARIETGLDILLIKKQFLCGIPIDRINLHKQINIEQQREIFNNTINDNLVKKYPIKQAYQQAFLRKFVQNLENNNEDIDDELYEILCKFLSTNDTSTTHYRHFLMKNHSQKIDRIIIKESKSIISEGTTGLCSWQAAEALAEWCTANREQIDDKCVLELGSGVGLTGLTVLSTCLPNKYTFTDCHPSVLKLLKENISLNLSTLQNNEFPNINVNVINFNWELINQFTSANWSSPDLILAADVVYDTSIFHSLITALKLLLTRANSYAIIAITVRNESTMSNFITQLGTYGLMHKEEIVPNYSIFFPNTETPPEMIDEI